MTVDPALAVGVDALYYNRNRHYDPSLGRFLQRDPNETGQETLPLAYNGQAIFIVADGFNANGLYGDGMSLCLYLAGNPINVTDALGLFTYGELAVTVGGQAQLQALGGGAAAAFAYGLVANLIQGQTLRNSAINSAITATSLFIAGAAGLAVGETLVAASEALLVESGGIATGASVAATPAAITAGDLGVSSALTTLSATFFMSGG